MNKMRLDTFISDYGDGIHGTPTYSDNGEYCFINGNNLNDGCIVVDDNTLRINSDEYERIKRSLSDRTVLLSINGSLGKTALYNGEKIALGKSACYINIKETYSREFFRYILTTKEFQDYMLRVAHGSTIKNFAPSQVGEYEIELPDISEHKAIGCLLSALDQKVANNSSICSDLEGVAKLLYDYWFVQFDFPDVNGKPYKSSGGKMVWNEQLKREIPEGWQVGKVSDLGDIIGGATPTTTNPEYYTDNGIAWATPKDLADSNTIFFSHGERDITKLGLDNCSATIMPKGSVLMTSRAPIGYLAIAENEVCTNQGFKSVIPYDTVGTYYVYYTLQLMMPYIKRYGVGSTFAEVSKQDLDGINVIIPDKRVCTDFNSILNDSFERICLLEQENRQLANLRDFLLPMLMNGQVKVGGC